MKEKESKQPNDAPVDHFADLSKLKIDQSFTDSGVRKALLHIPVRKPTPHEFVRVHPDEAMRLRIAMVEVKEERGIELFPVLPEVAQQLPGRTKIKILVTAFSKQEVLFLWPLNSDVDQGRRNLWNETARAAADLAMKDWINVVSNRDLGGYEAFPAVAKWPDPEWPTYTFQEIFKIAFKDKLITSMDHIVIRKLRGEV